MQIVAKVAKAVQSLLGTWAEEVAQTCGVIRRTRKFTAATLAQTFVFGFLARPDASDEHLAQTAAVCGVDVTTQAVEQRFTHRLAEFLEALFRKAILCAIGADNAPASLLERFAQVILRDSTTITLPPELGERFPGCGGSHGSGQAAVKFQVQWDLRSGALQAIAIEAGRDCDYKTSLQSRPLPPGSLRISDLGYFDTDVFQRLSSTGVFWLSRLQFGTAIFSPEGKPLSLPRWLSEQPGPVVDQSVLMGSERKVPCRMVAWRVPAEVANRRRQKLIAAARRKDGRTPGQERLAWCDWMILVTNVPADLLTPTETAVLYRARWQIELLFKRWKSLGLVADLTGATVPRQLVRLWSRLLAVVVQHWLLLTSAWGDARHSLAKACQAIRRHAVLLFSTVGDLAQLQEALACLRRIVHSTARQNKHKRPSTFELLNDPSLLEYSLT